MKKLSVFFVMAAFLAFIFTGCGASAQQMQQIDKALEEFNVLCARAGTAVAQINNIASPPGMVTANFSPYYSQLMTQYSSLLALAKDGKKPSKEEAESLADDIKSKTAAAKPTVEGLEAVAGQIKEMDSQAKALVQNLTQIIALAAGKTANQEQEAQYAQVSADYASLKENVNTLLAQDGTGGLKKAQESLQQANEQIKTANAKAEALLKSLTEL